MNRRRCAHLLILTMCVALASSAAAMGPAVERSYDPSEIAIETDGAYSRVAIEGASSIGTPGAPALPVQYLQFVIPPDARVEDVLITRLDEVVLPGVHRVAPAQPEVPIGEPPRHADPDPTIYGRAGAYPEHRVEYLGDGYLGGYRIAGVAVYPVRYEPATGTLTLARALAVELSLAPDADRSQTRHRMTARSHDLYRRIVEGLVANPEEVSGRRGPVEIVDDVGPAGFLPRYTPSLEGSPVEYVIVTDDELVDPFQVLADWKTKKGVPTVVRTVSWIEANYPGGSDAAERVRFFLKDAYASWGTTYVLLGGDTEVVPIRFAWSDYYGGWEIPTDLYYSDIDGNWNGDGDGLFGEGYGGASDPGDTLDLHPDLFVGRAPVRSVAEAEVFVEKALTYEKAPDPIFAGRNLFMAEVLFPYDWEPGELVSTDGASIIESILPLIPPEVHYTRLYQNPVYPGSYLLTRQTAVDSLTAGYNISAHVGHAYAYLLRCGGQGQYLTIADADELRNGQEKSGLGWMLNCSSVAVDVDCIGEHFLRNPDGGFSSLFGPTRYAFPTTTKDYFYQWFVDLYVDNVRQAGVVCATCKIPFVPESNYDNTDRWTQLSFVYLGDPEAELWAARTEPLAVAHAPSIVLGPTDLPVTVTDPSPVEGALVCVVKDDEVYARGETDVSGEVVLSFTPETTGTMTITVTATDHFPYEGEIVVTPTPAPHLSLRSTVVDDDALGLSDGNGNGLAEAGEVIELDIVVGNGGGADALGVSATLTGGDPYVSVVDGIESLGDVPALSEVTYEGAFVLAIDDGCPNEHDVVLGLELSDAARTTWPDDLGFRVYRPILIQAKNDVDDGPGGNGVPDPGESVTLTVDVLNEGNGRADQVTGVLRYPNAEVTLTDTTDSWGDIEPGATVTGQAGFAFEVNAAITDRFELILSDEDGKEWRHRFDLTRPAAPESLTGSAEGTTITLEWMPRDELDLWGYNVYRADPGGDPTLANDGVVERIAYFEDTDLEGTTLYDYYVTAVDSSGNESEPSASLGISTNPPSMPGWPLELTHPGAEPMYGTPAVCDADLDGDLEVFVGCGPICCWHHTGVELLDGDGDARTNGPFEDAMAGGTRTSIAVGEMDGDTYPELVAAGWDDVGSSRDPAYEVWAWNADDGTVVDGWPVTTAGPCWASANLADLSGDGLDEVVIPCFDGKLYVWRHDGTELIDGDNDPATDGVFASLHASFAFASAAIADIDNDHALEILCGSRSDSVYCWNADGTYVPGWPVDLGADVRTTIAVGDVDGDGGVDVVAGTTNDEVYLLDASGVAFPNWPRTVVLDSGGTAGDFPPSPALANLDARDEDLEIVVPGADGSLHVFTWEGDELPGWPQEFDTRNNASPAVGDVDGDADMEILIGSYNEAAVFAFHEDGTVVDGWPIATGAEVWSTPTLADLDGDGDVEVVLSGMDRTLYNWDCDGDYGGGAGVEWPTFMHDFRRWSHYGYEAPADAPEDDIAVGSRLSLEQSAPNPFNPVTTIAYTVPADVGEVELCVYDVTGRLVRVLLAGKVEPGRREISWDGRDARGERVSSGVYLVRLSDGRRTVTGKAVLLK
jgi:hypothetical protein